MPIVDLKSIPAKAWVVIGGVTFDAVDVALLYSAASLPTANVSLAVGYNFDGSKVFDSDALGLFTDNAEGEVFVEINSESDLPGLPRGIVSVFKGYVSSVSPSVGADAGTTLGIQLQHKGMSDLSSGTTIQWGEMLTTGRPYPPDKTFALSGLQLTGGLLVYEGLMPSLHKLYQTYLESADANAGVTFQKCVTVSKLNAASLAALATVGGSALKMRSTLANDGAMYDFLKARIENDLWTQSVAEQLQALGQDLFFRVVPRMDGSVDIRPLTAFGAPSVALDAEHLFAFHPTNTINRRIAGVIMMARIPNGPSAAAGRVGGCYVFPSDLVRSGAVQVIDLPSWLTTSIAQSQRNVDAGRSGVDMIGNPAAIGARAPATIDITAETGARAAAAARTYGDAFAREVARKLRYQECVAELTSYFRTDIGVLSTLRVNSPVALDREATIYGRVDTITLSISSQTGTALSTFGLSYVRSEQTQNSILDDGGSEHPLYTDTWAGSSL